MLSTYFLFGLQILLLSCGGLQIRHNGIYDKSEISNVSDTYLRQLVKEVESKKKIERIYKQTTKKGAP